MRSLRNGIVVVLAAGAVVLPRAGIEAQRAAGGRGGAIVDSLELATTVKDGFTIVTVGDTIIANSLTQFTDPAFEAVVKLLRAGDVTTGNYEGNIIDGRHFKGSAPGGFGGEPAVATTLKDLGFDLLARPNNHADDFGPEGVKETSEHLDRAGVAHAGVGDTYWAARAARFVSTPRGRVGMVATASSYGSEQILAAPGRGEWLGRGGISGLRTTPIFIVPPSMWQAVKTIRDAFPNGTGFYAPPAGATEMSLLGERFKLDPSATEPHFSFEMNKQDLQDILAMVREGKMKSDFITVAIHAHQFRDAKGSGYRGPNLPENEGLDTNTSVADFLSTFAKAAIDTGADLFQGTGVHSLRGIEIYKDRPIFYGLGEFFRQMDVTGLSGMGPLTRGESNSPPVKYESIVAVSRFENQKLAEVRLHPVDLNDTGRMAHRGIPRIASPETAQRVLTRLQKLSAPFGTTIAIEGNVGVIRPKATTTTSQGKQ